MTGVHPSTHALGDGHRVGDHGDDRRQPETIGQHPDCEGADELEQDGHRDVGHPRDEPDEETRQDPAQDDPTSAGQEELRQHGPPGEHAGHRRTHRQAVDEQRRGVVEQALSLEDDQQPVRRPELSQDCRRRGRIGRRHDRAERERRSPGHSGDHRAGSPSDRGNGEQDQDDGQTHHRPEMPAKVSRRGVVRSVEQGGGHEQRQGELRIEGDRGRTRDQREERSDQREERRIRDPQPIRPEGKHRACKQQEDDQLEEAHGRLSTPGWSRSGPALRGRVGTHPPPEQRRARGTRSHRSVRCSATRGSGPARSS